MATLLGLAVFKRRVRGAYFAILSQALAAAFAILLVGQQKVTGGTNGLNGFRSFFGFTLSDPVNKRMLYFIAAGVLLAMVAIVRLVMNSRYGELLVAVRDQENRVRFLGYDPAIVKTVAYAIAACFAAIGGALFTPIVGIISPADVGVVPSIGFLVGVAIGGRATLLGPVLGAIGVSLGGDLALGVVPVVLDLLPGRAVHPRRRVPAQRARDDRSALPPTARRACGARAPVPEPAASRPPGSLMSDDMPTTAAPLIGEGSLDPDALEQVIAADDARFKHDYLEIRDLRVVFDGFVAVAGVDLTVTQGDLRFLIGPNGAGKTTIVDAITGLAPATGSIRFGGVELVGQAVAQGRPRRGRPDVPDGQRVRRAHRAAEPRHRGGVGPHRRQTAICRSLESVAREKASRIRQPR